MEDSGQTRPASTGESGGEALRNGEAFRNSARGARTDSDRGGAIKAHRGCEAQSGDKDRGGSPALLDVRNLRVSYPLKRGIFGRGEKLFNAVDGVSFKMRRGEILGLVGESGSGKTTTGRAIVRLAPISGGEIFYGGAEISKLPNSKFAPYRKKIQMIFQDPFNSLNPRMSVFEIISEPLDIHFPKMTKAQKRDRAAELLEIVGLESGHMARFPHEFSGGQRQRIGIARALAVEPELVICDEPVSALDVSVQAQIINLLQQLRRRFNLTLLFIAHDIAVVEYLSDRIMVMTDGKIVEQGPARDVCERPQNPYTKKLIAAVPKF
ncbi:MAG: ABC transporter ATP-binding protein [Verrucomicrobia bacterium]|nr:MAG: ABC transporter ATP-binding protein [Verrucomicrobiota bacterium]